jgi:hypothetical protein
LVIADYAGQRGEKSEILSTKSETNPNDRNANVQNRQGGRWTRRFRHSGSEFVSGFEIRASDFPPAAGHLCLSAFIRGLWIDYRQLTIDDFLCGSAALRET